MAGLTVCQMAATENGPLHPMGEAWVGGEKLTCLARMAGAYSTETRR